MTQRFRWRRIAAGAVAAFSMLAGLAPHILPVALTEATWTDDVHTTSSFTASPDAGNNYARALGAYGEVKRDFSLFDGDSMRGYTVSRITGETPNTLTNNDTFSDESWFRALPVNIAGRRCARAARPTDDGCTPPNSATSFAVADVSGLRVHATNAFGNPDTALVTYTPAEKNKPLQVTASCEPGTDGTTGVSGTGVFRLGEGRDTRILGLPSETAPRTQQVRTALFTYRAALLYSQDSGLNFAWSQVAIAIETTSGSGGERWAIHAILARAECGNSRALLAPPTRPQASNPAVVWDPTFPLYASTGVSTLNAAATEFPTAIDGDQVQRVEAPDTAPFEAETAPTSETAPTTGPTVTLEPSPPTTSRLPSKPRSATPPPAATTPPATQVTTSTSALPAVAVPVPPGPLSPAARLEDIGTVTVGGDELVVVAPSDTARTDARQGLAALEIWLNGGDPGTTWTAFTSRDPGADGWRWAAVDRETGTVIYVR